MKTRSPFVDPKETARAFKKRAVVAFACVLILLSILIVRLFYLTVLDHQRYVTLSYNNQVRVVAIPAPRGLIFDRHGTLLAQNIPTFNLEIIKEHSPNLKDTLAALRKRLPITEREEALFYKELKQHRPYDSIPLKTQLTLEQVAILESDKFLLPGVSIQSRFERHYPFGPLLAHVVGYVSKINEDDLKHDESLFTSGLQILGKTGLESYYEMLLRGTPGYQEVETDAHGKVVRILSRTPPISGKHLYISIDLDLQKQAMNTLDGHRAAAVALDPKTGDVLVLVSTPSFDPNGFARGQSKDNYAFLTNARSRPLFNRALQGQYPPASTIKPLVAFAALEANTINPQHTIYDPGFYQLPRSSHQYRDWKKGGHGSVNLEKAIVESCDTYFYQVAERLGIARLSQALKKFGYGQKTGIDTTDEGEGVVPNAAWKRKHYHQAWYPGETLITGIGQGYALVTPVQMATAAARLANKGEPVSPHLVIAIEDDKGLITSREFQKPARTLSSDPKIWQFLHEAMRKVVHAPNGTAFRISKLLPEQIGGKTGTAQVFTVGQNEKYEAHNVAAHLRDHTLFIGFGPINQPTLALSLIVENEKGGADLAAPIFAQYLQRAQP